jgi:hypothetical protein
MVYCQAKMTIQTILWRRLDTVGLESARLASHEHNWQLAGTAVFEHEGQPTRLDYNILCDAVWRTRSARVSGWVGAQLIEIRIDVDEEGHWQMNGKEQPEVTGCTDLDLNFSPVTNLLPVRRLELAVGQAAEVKAAWLRFPSFDLEPLQQVYFRSASEVYRYESAGGAFVRDLTVSRAGFVTDYPDYWEMVASQSPD